jgi:hypothetical protein
VGDVLEDINETDTEDVVEGTVVAHEVVAEEKADNRAEPRAKVKKVKDGMAASAEAMDEEGGAVTAVAEDVDTEDAEAEHAMFIVIITGAAVMVGGEEMHGGDGAGALAPVGGAGIGGGHLHSSSIHTSV